MIHVDPNQWFFSFGPLVNFGSFKTLFQDILGFLKYNL